MIPSEKPEPTSIVEQQSTTEYWNERVEQRKPYWSPQTRKEFEQGLTLIEGKIQEARERLAQNPNDAIARIKLDKALEQKMAHLKEFSNR